MRISKEKLICTKKGITLISLVVTIIILLILAGITINLVLAEGGIFKRANDAKIEQRKAQILDKLTLAEADVSVSAEPIGKPTIREYLDYVYNKGIAIEKDEEVVEENKEYNIYTEDGLIFNIKIEQGTNVNDIIINYEGTANNLPVIIHSTRMTIDEETVKGKVYVTLIRAENATSYTYLYKQKDATDYIEFEGTGPTFTYEGLTIGETYLFKAIVNGKSSNEITVTIQSKFVKIGDYNSLSQQEIDIKSIFPNIYNTLTIDNFVMLNIRQQHSFGNAVDNLQLIFDEYNSETGILKLNSSHCRSNGYDFWVEFSLYCILEEVTMLELGDYNSLSQQEIDIKSILPNVYNTLTINNFVILNAKQQLTSGNRTDNEQFILNEYNSETGILKLNSSYVRTSGYEFYTDFTLGCIMEKY